MVEYCCRTVKIWCMPKGGTKMTRFYKSFIFDIVVAVIALTLGIVMLPPFGIGEKALNILLAVALVAYLVIHLFGKLVRSKGSTFILTLIEFAVISLITLGLVLQQFKVFNISGVCETLGFILWLRGAVAATAMYITLGRVKSGTYSLPRFMLYVLLISVGMYLFAHPLITNLAFNWMMCIFFFASALVFAGLAVLYSPTRSRR